MDASTPGVNHHHVPPLPQRRGSATTMSSFLGRSSPLVPVRHRVQQQQQQQTSGPVADRRPSGQNERRTAERLSLETLALTTSRCRAPDNDYREVPTEVMPLVGSGPPPSTIDGLVQPPSVPTSIVDVWIRSETPKKDVDRAALPPSKKSAVDDDDVRRVIPDIKKPSTTTTDSRTRSRVSSSSSCRETIICQRCGRCRCAECSRPSTPCGCAPSTARGVVEVASCVFCVRTLSDRAGCCGGNDDEVDDDDEDDETTDDPFACGPGRPRRRWVLMVAASLCIPCLCFYWPLRWATKACGACRRPSGCRCPESAVAARRRRPRAVGATVDLPRTGGAT